MMAVSNSGYIFLIAVNVIFLVLLLFLLKNLKQFIRYWTLLHKLPTGHGKQIILGHAAKLIGQPPEHTFNQARKWSQRAPPVYTMFLGPTLAFVCVIGPVELEVIGSIKNLEKSKGYDFFHDWLEQGLLTSAGVKWQKRRKILTPAFHFTILLDFVDTFNRETKHFLKEIHSKYLRGPLNIVPLISDFTLLTITETSMGTKLEEHQEGLNYKKAILELGHVGYERLICPWLWYNPIFKLTNLRKKGAAALEVINNFTNKIIQKRAQNFKTFNEEFGETLVKRKHPLLDVLLNACFKNKDGIDKQGIREEVNTFMFEGHDTTSMCLNFTTMLLACHKDIQEGVYQEIISTIGPDQTNDPSYSDLQQLSLLDRCLKESMRLYPPVPLIARKASEDIITKYGIIPKGANVFTHVYDVHRDPNHWPEPDKFDPSRHLPENSVGRHPFSYIPFSAGPRNCIGGNGKHSWTTVVIAGRGAVEASNTGVQECTFPATCTYTEGKIKLEHFLLYCQRFAMLEMKAFFCGLLRQFVLLPIDTPETIVVIQDMILRSKNGIRVKFELRN